MALSNATIPSPRRNARLGAISLDMWGMILMIVAILGVATFAILQAGDVARDESYAQAAESFPEQANASLREGERALAHIRQIVGSDKAGFEEFWIKGNNAMPTHTSYTGKADEADGRALSGNGISFAQSSKTKGDERLFATDVGQLTLSQALIESDKKIVELVQVVSTWTDLQAAVDKAALGAANDYKTSVDEKLAEVTAAVARVKLALQSAIESLKTDNDIARKAHDNGFTSAEASYDALLRRLHSATLSDSGDNSRITLDQALSNARNQIAELSKIREEVIAHFARRTGFMAGENDFKGYVIDADRENGWAWINIGQAQNVRKGIIFDVQRPSEDKSGMIDVARLQVNLVLPDGGSRCRVISSIGKFYPQNGDSLLQPNFSSKRYTYYSLIGDFGGTNSRYSREELTRLLNNHDMVVDDIPTARTEVLVFGENALSDSRLDGLGPNKRFPYYEKYTEDDLLYIFGIIGPAAKR